MRALLRLWALGVALAWVLAGVLRAEDGPAAARARARDLLEAGDPTRAERMLAPWLARAEGVEAETFELLGRIREARREPTAAAAWRTAVLLDPGRDAGARALARLGRGPGWPIGAIFAGLGEAGPAERKALVLLWAGAAAEALRALGSCQGALCHGLKANALGELGRFAAAEEELVALDRLVPGTALAAFLRSGVAQWNGDAEAEERWLEAARAALPGSPDVEAAQAARAAATGRTEEVARYLEWEKRAAGPLDPWRLAARAALLAAAGRLVEAREVLDALAVDYPDGPQALIVEAGLALRTGERERGIEALGRIVERAPGNLLLVPAANLLASMGRSDLAATAAARLEPAVGENPHIRQMLGMLASGPFGGKGREGVRGAFRWRASAGSTKDGIELALAIFGAAREAVDKALGRAGPDPIELVLVLDPGESPWGFYDGVGHRIVARGDFRRAARAGERDLVEHVARHEYAHLAFDALVRRPGEGLVPFPRWMMEGIADHLAGGIGYLERFGYRLAELDPTPLSDDQLARILSMPILGAGSIPKDDQARAYAQAHGMVGRLLEALPVPDRWTRLAVLARKLGLGADLDAELARATGLAVVDLLQPRPIPAQADGAGAGSGSATRKPIIGEGSPASQ